MLLVIAMSHKDAHLALRQADRIAQWGGLEDTPILVVANIRAKVDANNVAAVLLQSVRCVEVRVLPRDDDTGWPVACNYMFKKVAGWAESRGQPWLFMEPDMVPLCPGWWQALESEYSRCGKRFMGVENATRAIDRRTGEIVVIGKHMVGAGIYPANLASTSKILKYVRTTAWDIYMQHEIVPRCHFTDLIQHNWATVNYRQVGGQIIGEATKPEWKTRNTPVSARAVLLHGCKDTSLYDLPTEDFCDAVSRCASPALFSAEAEPTFHD